MEKLPESELMKIIRQLLREYGYSGIRSALLQINFNEKIDAELLGIPSRAEKCQKLIEKLHKMPKGFNG